MKTSRLLVFGMAACALVAARVSLRLGPAACVRWASVPDLALAPPGGTRARLADALAGAVGSVGARTGASCLEQAFALVLLLSLARTQSRLVLGVRRPNGRFAAHAWVESQGRILLGAGGRDDFLDLRATAILRAGGD